MKDFDSMERQEGVAAQSLIATNSSFGKHRRAHSAGNRVHAAGNRLSRTRSRLDNIPILRATAVLSFIDVLHFRAAGVDFRIYYPLTLMLVVANFPEVLRELGGTRLGRALTLFTLITGATLLWTISLPDTESVVVGQVYLLLLFATFAAEFRRGTIIPSDVLRWIGWGASLSSVAAILEFVASYGGSHVQIFNVVGIPWHRPAGLMTEPDWAGLVAAVGVVAVFYGPRTARLRRTFLAANLMVVLLAGVRDVWLSSLVLLVILGVTSRSSRRAVKKVLPLLGVAVLGIGLYAFHDPHALSRLDPAAVLSASGAGDSGSTHSREAVINFVTTNIGPRFLQGYGAGSLAYETQLPVVQAEYGGAVGAGLNTGHGSTNLLLTTLWDSGVAGLLAILFLIKQWLGAARRLSRETPWLLWLSGLFLLDFQINDGFRFAFVWIVLACCTYGEIQASNERAGTHRASRRPAFPMQETGDTSPTESWRLPGVVVNRIGRGPF